MGSIMRALTACGSARGSSTPKRSRGDSFGGSISVPKSQSHTARQLPRLQLKCAGLVKCAGLAEWWSWWCAGLMKTRPSGPVEKAAVSGILDQQAAAQGQRGEKRGGAAGRVFRLVKRRAERPSRRGARLSARLDDVQIRIEQQR